MATSAIQQFHNRLNAGLLDDVYRDADESFRRSGPREGLIAAMQAVRIRFGNFRQQTAYRLNVVVGVPIQIRAVCGATFDKGNATELFLFLRQGDRVLLSRYEIYPGKVNLDSL